MTKLTGKTVLDRIFIIQSEGEKQMAGMVIPDSEVQKPCHGEVVLVGPGISNSTTGEFIPMTVKVGDKVIYDHNCATEVRIEGVDYLQVREGTLLYIFDK